MKRNRPLPKLLPWLARKARISDMHAEELWNRAVAEVAAAGPMAPARRHSMALDRLLELVAAEALVRRAPLYQLSMAFRTQAQLWNIGLNLWERITLAMAGQRQLRFK